MDFHAMKRKELQALCKKHNIHANGTNFDLVDRLTSLLKKSVLEPKLNKGLVGNESKIVTRQAKKVRFYLEEENVQDGNRNIVDTPVRMTRSRKGTELVVFSPSPNAKKKTRRGGKKDENDNGVKNTSTAVVSSESVSEVPIPTTRSRRGTDLVVLSPSPGVKKKTRIGGKMAASVSGVENASTSLVLFDNDISGSSAIKEDSVRVTRSLRSKGILLEGVDLNLQKKDTSSRKRTREVREERQNEVEVGDVAMKNTRQTRSRKKDNELVNNVSNSQIVKRSKWIGSAPAKSVRIDGKKVKEAISDNVVQIVNGESNSVPKPENAPRRSKRNAIIEEDTVQSDGQSRTNGVTGDVSVLKKNTRQSRSRKQDNEQVSNVSGSQIVKEESKYSSKPEERVTRRSKGIDPATDYSGILNGANVKEAISDIAPRRSKRNATTEEDAVQSRTKGVIGNKVSLAVVGESQNASKLEPAPRRSSRSSVTIQLSGVTGNHKPGKSSSKIEEPPRMSIIRVSKRKSMASTNVRVEQPVRRRRQNSTDVENVALTDVALRNEEDGRNSMVPERRVRGLGKSNSSVRKSYSIREELPRRSTRGGSRRESIAIDSRVAISSDLKHPNIPENGRAAQKKGKTTSGGCREPKPRAKTSSGKRGRGKTVIKRTEQKSDIQEDVEGSTQQSPESAYQLELSCIREVPEDSELCENHMKLDLQVNATSEQVSQLVDSTVLEGKVTVDDSLVIAEEESSHIVNEVKSVLTGGKIKTRVGSNISNHTEGSAVSEIGLLKDVGDHVGFQEAQPELICCVHTAVPKAFDIAGEVSHPVMEFQVRDEDALPSSTEESVSVIAEATSRQCNVSEMDEPFMPLEKADGETEKDAVMNDTIFVEEIRYQALEERLGDYVTTLGTNTDKYKELGKVAPMEEPLERQFLIDDDKLEKDVMLVETTLVEVITNEQQEYLDDNVTASEPDHENFEESVKVATAENPLETAVVIGDGGHVRKVFLEVDKKEGNAETSVEEFGGEKDEVAAVMLRELPETSGNHCTCEYENNLATEKEEKADEAFECNSGRSVADDGHSGTSLLSQACSPSLDNLMNVAADRESVDFENKADFVEEVNEKDTMPEVLEVPVHLRKDVSLELLGLVNTVTEDQISKVGDPLEERTVMNTISDCKDGGIVTEDEIAGTSPLTQAYTPSNVENVEDEEDNLDCAFENIGSVVESEVSFQQVPKELLELKQGEEEEMHKRCNVELDGNIFETDSFFSHSVESVTKNEVEARTSPLLFKKEAVSSGLISGKIVVMEEENSGSPLSQSFRQNTFKETSSENKSVNEIDINSVQESWKTDEETVEYHPRGYTDLKKDLDLEMHDLVDVVSGERDYKSDHIFMKMQFVTAERGKAGKDDSDFDELVEEYPVLQQTHKILLEGCETEKEIQINAEATSGKICGEKSYNTAFVCVGENVDTECLPFVASEEQSGSTEAFIAEGNLWGDGAYSERTCKRVDGSLGTTHQILEELGDRENSVVHADGEDNGCFVSTPEFLSYEFCQDEKEDIQVNSNYQTELGSIREALPETAAVSSSYCSEFPLVNAARCQGNVEAKSDTTAYEHSPLEVELFSGDNKANEDAAIIQNRTCGEILEPKEMSEAIREDKGLTDWEIDSSLFTVDPSNDRIICNKQEQEYYIDNATVSLAPDQVGDDGDGLEVTLVLSPKDFSNSNPSINMTRDDDSMESSLKKLFDIEEAEVHGAMLESTAKSCTVENNDEEDNMESSLRILFAVEEAEVHEAAAKTNAEFDVMDEINCLLTKMRISSAVKGRPFSKRTPVKLPGCLLQCDLLESRMKENIRNTKTEHSADCQVKPATKRRALEDLQNCTERE